MTRVRLTRTDLKEKQPLTPLLPHIFNFQKTILSPSPRSEIYDPPSTMALRLVYVVAFISASCAFFMILHLLLQPVFYFTTT
ncbi:hypothetical protein L2E82_32927 [Cichorium intybus]|uniref:Uncharacterized protein n=1 Tax=Cichorium intybus TaxID=13427 RepID=A0ACB9BIY2_CICIN|nr:hypothetical protein L2E82_32927 [Cichorium intybus]